MSAQENVLVKIKLLLNLINSPNVNEAANAQSMVDKLIVKYEITPEELESIKDKKPLYGESDKLFTTMGLSGWRQRLALAIGKHFFCQIVQEELVPLEGLHQFDYFVYGDKEDADNVKLVYNTFVLKIEDLLNKKCSIRGPVYVSSYCEGVVEAIISNIHWEGIDIPNLKSPSRTKEVEESKVLNNGTSNLTKHKEEKEKPVQETVDVTRQSLIKDINAYFKGLEDGNRLDLAEMLELEESNKTSPELTT
jgi:hypothetical protein